MKSNTFKTKNISGKNTALSFRNLFNKWISRKHWDSHFYVLFGLLNSGKTQLREPRKVLQPCAREVYTHFAKTSSSLFFPPKLLIFFLSSYFLFPEKTCKIHLLSKFPV